MRIARKKYEKKRIMLRHQVPSLVRVLVLTLALVPIRRMDLIKLMIYLKQKLVLCLNLQDLVVPEQKIDLHQNLKDLMIYRSHFSTSSSFSVTVIYHKLPLSIGGTIIDEKQMTAMMNRKPQPFLHFVVPQTRKWMNSSPHWTR